MTDDLRHPPHYSQLVRALADKFDAITAAENSIDDASDPGAAVEAVNALREEALHIAIEVFAWGALARVQPNLNPTTEERAAAIVAERLMAIPRNRDDIKHRRVIFPYVFPWRAWTTAEERERNCCVVVCRLILQGISLDKAMEQAEERFCRSHSWVRAAYYKWRDYFEPLVKLEPRGPL